MKNNKLITRISALALASMFLFSGCGINGSKTFATLNDAINNEYEELEMGE